MRHHNSISKRFKVTPTGKVLKRATGQDHFNARDTGTATRYKRRDRNLTGKLARNIKRLI
jgi:ribosomal protein L35